MLSRVRTRASRSERAASSSATLCALTDWFSSERIRSLCRPDRYTAIVGKPNTDNTATMPTTYSMVAVYNSATA